MTPQVAERVRAVGAEDVNFGVLGTWGMILLHASCLLIFATGISWAAAIACVLTYWLRVIGITVGYHRCLAHRTFKTGRVFQFILAWLGTSTLQRGPLWFVSLHRRHHRFADTEHDVHSPVAGGFWWSHIGWILCPRFDYADESLVRDLAAFPELCWLDRNFLVPPAALAATLAILGWILPGTSALQMVLWGFVISTVLVYHATFSVNSIAHQFGSRPYETNDNSRNNLFLAVIMLGEGFHNNHHRFPSSARFALQPKQLDLGYCILVVLEKLRLIREMKIVVPETRP